MTPQDKNLSKLLNAMARNDQDAIKRARRTLIFDDRVRRTNTMRLKKIVEKYGWPTIHLVGKKASRSAWLIVQHVNHDVRFQKRCLKLMKEIYLRNPQNISLENIAFLTDKILVHTKKKQLFGTQFYVNKVNEKGVLMYCPIKDFKNLDKRRKEYGIPPFKEYLKAVKSVKPLRIRTSRSKLPLYGFRRWTPR